MKEKNTMKSFLNSFTLGVTIGIFISLFINYLLNTNYYMIPTPTLVNKLGSHLASLVCVITFGLIGVFSNLSSFVFEKEEWSLLKATIIHFLLLQVLILIIGYVFDWLSYYFIMVLPISIFVYVVIWTITYFYYKKEIGKLKAKI